MNDSTNKIKILRLCLIFLLFTIHIDVFPQGLWLETNINYSYRKNDFHVKQLENYNIIDGGIQAGITPIQIDSVGALQFYITGNLIYDASKQRWNYADWHNNFVYGIGSRIRFSPLLFAVLKEFNIEFFAEKFWIKYFPDTLFFTGHRPLDDIKSGLRYGVVSNRLKIAKLSQNPREQFYFWFNSYGGLYYSKSSFYNISQTGFYLLDISSKVGLGINYMLPTQLEFYLIEDLNLDLGANEWNKLLWNNRLRFGGGVQLKYLRFPVYKHDEINLEISPYFEYLFIKYARKVNYIPSYIPEYDIQAGLKLWLSISQETK